MKKTIFLVLIGLMLSLIMPSCSGKSRLTASGYKKKSKKSARDYRKLDRIRIW